MDSKIVKRYCNIGYKRWWIPVIYILFLMGVIYLPRRHISTSVKYISSPLEALWLQKIPTLAFDANGFCDLAKAQEDIYTKWLQSTQSGESFDSEIFSRFIYEDGRIEWIEPLAVGLRHPKAICIDGKVLTDKSHIILASHKKNRRYILADVGGSLWGKDKREANSKWRAQLPSQSWFYESYGQNGIQFDRFLVWESNKYDQSDLFQEVPNDLFDAYQYFNIPAEFNRTSRNPLNLVKKIKQRMGKDVFAVLKLDADTSAQWNIVDMMIESDENIVDEFFWEQEVGFSAMNRVWSWQMDWSKNMTDVYDSLLKLRLKGIRAHGWI